MGIGMGQALLLRALAGNGAWNNIKRVCDLGSQEPRPEELADLFESFDLAPLRGNFCAKEFYEYLGAAHYISIDFNGERGSLPFDLNRNLRADYYYHEVFDLVTNFGTSEHCFNQFDFFRNIHHLCNRGGYMLHTVPTQGWGRHSFFRYDSNFFEDLAASNDYQIVLLEPFLRLKPYLRMNKEDTLQHVLTLCAFAESEFDKLASRNDAKTTSGREKTLCSGALSGAEDVQRALANVGKECALFNVTLACLLKKNGVREFATPIQGMYQQHARG